MFRRLKKFSVYLSVIAMMGGASAMTAKADSSEIFLPGSTINEVSVSGMTDAQAREKLTQHYQGEYEIEFITSDNKKEKIAGSEIGYQVQLPDMNGMAAQARTSGENKINLDVSFTYNEESLKEKLKTLNCVSGDQVVTTQNARISDYEEGKPFTIIEEVQGNSLNMTSLIDATRHELMTGSSAVFLDPLGCYERISIDSENPELKALLERMNALQGMEIIHTFGDAQEKLEGNTIASWVKAVGNAGIEVDREKVTQYVAQLAQKYDTANTTRTFKSASGRDVSVSGSYGWAINQAAEIQALVDLINAGQSQTREPAYLQGAVSRNLPDWGGTFVEIDLTGQHVYMFQNGVVVWDAPCVTGNVKRGDTTPPGIFTLKYKQTDRVLRGKIMADGKPEYESPVKYWMPFNGGIGLHDANWRSKFGGEIYKNGGSHGCINLPPNTVKALYDMVYPGIPVICYN